jgi:hypothetical protein
MYRDFCCTTSASVFQIFDFVFSFTRLPGGCLSAIVIQLDKAGDFSALQALPLMPESKGFNIGATFEAIHRKMVVSIQA